MVNFKFVESEDIIKEFLNQNPVYKSDTWCAYEMRVANESIRPVERGRSTIDFSFCENNFIKNEIKYYFGRSLKESLYSVITIFEGKAHYLKRMLRFFDKRYPDITSVLEVPKEELILKQTI